MAERTHPHSTVEIVTSRGPRKDTINLEAKRDGVTFEVTTLHRDHAGKKNDFAKKVGMSVEEIQARIDKTLAVNEAKAKPGLSTDVSKFFVILRGMHQPKASGKGIHDDQPLAGLKAALAIIDYPAPEPVIEWEGTRTVACLDVDHHATTLEQRPGDEQLRAVTASVQPKPALWWITHGRGLRLVYVEDGGFQADELAACAALSARSLMPAASLEILSRTRHPAYPRPNYPPAGAVVEETPTVELGVLARWMGRDLDAALVDDWLAEQGFKKEGKYPHHRCPVDPNTPSHGEPVFVGDTGIFCLKCEASGITLGSNKAGFFPYTALIAGGISRRLRQAARHFCHWEHAQHVVAEDVGITGPLAKLCYAAMLKLVNGTDDPRNYEAMYRGEGLVRMDGYWATADLSRAHVKDGLAERLNKLPAVRYRTKDDLGVNDERLGIFRGIDDLTPYGYPRVQPVRGMKIFGHFGAGQDPRVVRALILPPFLANDDARPYRPHYVPLQKRMALADAERIVSESFPGINYAYLKLLIAARGCAESGMGQQPMIAVDGPSGSGKSTTVAIAAAMIGDKHVNVPWNTNLEHFQQGLYEASNSSGLVTSDEIIKLSTAKGDVLAGLNALLTFTQGSMIRKLYTGPVSVGQVPAIVLTDIAFPRELHCDEQLGRRHVHVHLDRKVDWQHTAKDIHRWRTLKPEHAEAANAIVSDVIDRFFASDTPLAFEDIARELGFGLLNQADDIGLDPKDDLRTLFTLCCSEKALTAPATTWKGPGWKYIKRDGADPLSQHWQRVCDNMNDGFVSSRRVKETDWAQLLGVPEAVECDLSPNGSSALAIRFRCGASRSKDLKVNEQIQVAASSKVVHVKSGDSTPTGSSPSQPPDDEPPASDPPSNPPGPPPPPSGSPSPSVEVAGDPLEGFQQEPNRDAELTGSTDPLVALAPVFLDVETRSACDLKKVGGRIYARHSTTELMTLVAMIDKRIIAWSPLLSEPLPAGEIWPDGFGARRLSIESFAGPNLPPPLADAIAAGRPLCAHNAFGFDRFIWEAKQLPQPASWIDTLPHARAAGLPGQLDILGERLFGRGKDKEGAALLKRLCQPDHRGQFIPFNRSNGIKVMRYNIADVVLLARVYEVARGHAETDVVALDETINNRGVSLDGDLARSLIRLEAEEAKAVGNRVEHLTGGEIKASDLRRDKFLMEYLHSRGTCLTNLRRETVHKVLHASSPLDPVARAVLEARLAVNRVTTGKLHAALIAQDGDGRLRDTLVYHQAFTGRWSSRRVQLHNLPRPHKDLKDVFPLLDLVKDPAAFRAALPPTVSVADAISALVRPTICAAPGKKLCMGDFASIEARGVAWCADDQTLLERYARGEDVYCGLASHIFGRPITKKDDAERQIGKQGILGCGYGMGADTFAQRCADLGIDLAAANTTAGAVVEGYRDAYPKIAGVKVTTNGHTWRQSGLWKDLEAAARDAIIRGVPQRAGRCLFTRDGGNLLIELPSGRRLCYRNARVEYAVPSYCQRMGLPPKQKPTILFDHPKEGTKQAYGGMLTENVVQAICRDLLVAAMLECERQGLPVVLHVHDEIVIEVTAGDADEALQKLAAVMSTPPAWASGFPIEVEGFACERYTKAPAKGAKVVKARDSKCV